MALLNNKKGVKCDLCHLDLIGKFEYYSYSFSKTRIIKGMPPSLLHTERANQDEIDVCENCHENFSELIIVNNANKKLCGTLKQPKAFCEISGIRILSGLVFVVDVSKVFVHLKPNDKNITNIDDKFLQFVISKESKQLFEPKPILNTASQSWETKS